MTIINEYGQRVITTSQCKLVIKDQTIKNVEVGNAFAYVLEILMKFGFIGIKLTIIDYKKTKMETMVLLALTKLNNHFVVENEEYELSFAYAVPLNRDLFLLGYVIDNLEYCLDNNQVVLLTSKSLYLYETINLEAFNKILNREKRTIRRNTHVRIQEVSFTDSFFDFWKKYDLARFNEKHSDDFMMFFKKVYDLDPFKLFAYYSHEKIVAYNVCYYSETQKVIYDVLFPWIFDNSVCRIGIYSIINNLSIAVKMGWGYSICYGIFDYKTQLLKDLKGVN